MARPTSFRLQTELLERLDAEAATSGMSITALVSVVLDEGLKVRRFPGIVYRDGPAGRRAGLVSGPDVWELIRAVRAAKGKGSQRIRQVAEERGLTIAEVSRAVDFYTAFPDEVDLRIAADEEAAREVRDLIDRRARLLSS